MEFNISKAVAILYSDNSLKDKTDNELVEYFNTPTIVWKSAELSEIQAYLFKKKLDLAIGALAKIEKPSDEILFALSRISQIFSAAFKTLDLTDLEILQQTGQILDILISNGVGTVDDKEALLDFGRTKTSKIDGTIDEKGVVLVRAVLQAQIDVQRLENELTSKVFTAKQRLSEYLNNVSNAIDVSVPSIKDILE